MASFKVVVCNMSVKMPFMKLSPTCPANHGVEINEQGEGFHQDIRVTEERYEAEDVISPHTPPLTKAEITSLHKWMLCSSSESGCFEGPNRDIGQGDVNFHASSELGCEDSEALK
ncbi:hypothetical protein PoB_005789200 [Plakobranchus ocellatus]|uniref:Uncharacterized protein n=1 Tax=Plakobranchus ocellatus TaxID=259542 RepID=A0AAV4CIU2_9GAST|nr:hypothetical protein PoB_005789200 [Plakobranchus ocellatus]